jgi:hypothetical protein
MCILNQARVLLNKERLLSRVSAFGIFKTIVKDVFVLSGELF